MKRQTISLFLLFFAVVFMATYSCQKPSFSAEEPPEEETLTSFHTLLGPPILERVQVFPYAAGNKPNYRIPNIVRASNGDILVIAEKRRLGFGDIGYTDIVMKRSTDLGATWGTETILYTSGNETNSDPTTLIDTVNNTIYLFFLRDKKRYYMMKTTDNGFTWSTAVSIHDQVIQPGWDTFRGSVNIINAPPDSVNKREDWENGWFQRYGVGPGNAGIRLSQGVHAGRLLVPARHLERQFGTTGPTIAVTHLFYSDDNGATWHVGPNIVSPFGNEAQLVELSTGAVMVNSRDADISDSTYIRRRINISYDGGNTWGTSYRDTGLVEPGCHGAIERFTNAGPGSTGRLLFSNPLNGVRSAAHPYGRTNVSVRISYDDGQTWSAGKTVFPYASAYTDLVVLSDSTVGMVYERGNTSTTTHYWDRIWFARFNLSWLTNNTDTIP